MRLRRLLAAASVTGLTLGGACGGGGNEAADVRTPDVEEMARAGKLTLADSQVVAALRAPQSPGRIIYDPPVDLSMANAVRTRPDLVRGDTTRRDTSRTATRRDTTGGDATADTSGGAARRRRP